MKLWSGRFARETDELVNRFQASIEFDRRLYRQDIRGSQAHARMLGRCGLITEDEARRIDDALEEILQDIEAGRVEFSVEAEDIHLNVETLLTERIGEVGKKLHTARSRNDQVALDLRLYLREEIGEVARLLEDLLETLLEVASRHCWSAMPGFTHLQKAQPVTLAHHLLAYCTMLRRDWERLEGSYHRTDVMPLGAGALAGTTLPIDRQMVAKDLGFARLAENTLDAVSDRDFALEFLAAASILMMHLSRLAEELVLWASEEFGYLELNDAFSTGSSMMPQKKNPDVAELIRGKTGRVYGGLVALLTVLKGLPLAYNKDLQEDKEVVFDAVDTVKACLAVLAPLLRSSSFKTERMAAAARRGFTNATDAADYLVRKGVPFREAHAVVGRLVAYALNEGKTLEELELAEYCRFSPQFAADIYDSISLEACLNRRQVPGGPAPERTAEALTDQQRWLMSARSAPWRLKGGR